MVANIITIFYWSSCSDPKIRPRIINKSICKESLTFSELSLKGVFHQNYLITKLLSYQIFCLITANYQMLALVRNNSVFDWT